MEDWLFIDDEKIEKITDIYNKTLKLKYDSSNRTANLVFRDGSGSFKVCFDDYGCDLTQRYFENVRFYENNDKGLIEMEVYNRKINLLIHFTNISNIKSILSNGILSVEKLRSSKLKYKFTDAERWDKRLDYVSTSIEDYNIYFFSTLSDQSNYCLIYLDSSILYELDCLYCFTNAANRVIRYSKNSSLNTYKAFCDMFDDEITYPTSYGVIRKIGRAGNGAKNLPTCNQAEVLIKNQIHTKYIKKIKFQKAISEDLKNLILKKGIQVTIKGESNGK